MTNDMKIGFIGQGFIGKHMADDFKERGYAVVRYSLEAAYVGNRAAIADCAVVFIAVPTPTTPAGFDSSALRAVLPLVGVGKIAVIKSTVLPGTTRQLQQDFPTCTLLHSPEFLREKHAAEDTRHPERTIIGVPSGSDEHRVAAKTILTLVPKAPYECICTSEEAELVKYGGNTFLALKVVYMNILYELAQAVNADYGVVAAGMAADPRIGSSHMQVMSSSGHGGEAGRGAGGHCFPKDLAALRGFYEEVASVDSTGAALLRAVEAKNTELLRDTAKDVDLLAAIYGT